MKKLILAIGMFSAYFLHAQGHFKGSSAIEIGAGLTRYGFYGTANYDKYLTSKLYLKGGLTAEKGKLENLRFARYYLNAAAYYNVYTLKDLLMVNIGVGAIGRLDQITAFENKSKQTNFNYGGFGAIEAELKTYKRFSTYAEFKQSFYGRKVFGSLIFFAGIGVKYNF